ncbi:MAG TPA: alpha/beta hydrolase [Euzebyales bacterium]|nr:alpha/beta hydrolase [Euzebyales bacterium]
MTAIVTGVGQPPIPSLQRVVHDGVALAFVEAGAGMPPVVLVHGLCDGLEVMEPLAERMSGGHRTVSIDLRGHGASDAPEGDYSVEALASDVAAVCDHLAITGAITVGHSLGGAVAVQLAASRPDLAAAVVMVDGALLFREDVLDEVAPLFDAIHSPAWREALHGFVDGGFIATDDPTVRAAAHVRVDALTRHAMVSAFDSAGNWDAEPALRACRMPMLYINSGSDLADLDLLPALCPQVELGRTVGVGHNQMLASPAQVAAMIDRFVSVHVTR